MTVTDGAAIIYAAAENWSGTDSKESIFTVTRRAASKLSADPMFNAAAYLKYCYGGLYFGEEDKDWMEAVKTVLKLTK